MSTRRRGPRRGTPPWLPCHKNVRGVQRLSSPNLSTNPCLHISTQRGMDPEQQSGTRQGTSQLEWTACASTRPPPPVFAEKMPRPSGLTFFLHFRRFRFLRRRWRSCGSSRDVHVDKRHVIHKFLHCGLVKSGNTVHTLNIPRDRGPRVYKKKRLWRAAMVPFFKARELPKRSDSNPKS